MRHSGLKHTVNVLVFCVRHSAKVCLRFHTRVYVCGCSNYGAGGLVCYSDLLLRVSR